MRRVAVVAAATLMMSTAALADGGPSYRRAPAAYAPVFTWTGLYLGTNIGYGWGDNDPVGVRVAPGNALDTVGRLESEGWFAGGQIGYNYQIGSIVLGVEADIQGSDISAGFGPVNFNGNIAGVFAGDSTIEMFGTLRARVGVAVDRMLLYVTGGYAWANIGYNVSGVIPQGVFDIRENTMFSGFVVGGGVEWAFAPNWSMKAEYQWINLGREDFSAQVLVGGAPTGFTAHTSATPEIQTFRLGVNYRFGDRHHGPLK